MEHCIFGPFPSIINVKNRRRNNKAFSRASSHMQPRNQPLVVYEGDRLAVVIEGLLLTCGNVVRNVKMIGKSVYK